MIVTQDEELAARLKRLRVHGGMKTYYHEEVGYNSRLDALQAAVLLAKLPHLESWSAARRKNAEYYNKAFADSSYIRTPVIDPAPATLACIAMSMGTGDNRALKVRGCCAMRATVPTRATNGKESHFG